VDRHLDFAQTPGRGTVGEQAFGEKRVQVARVYRLNPTSSTFSTSISMAALWLRIICASR
jgi:hypothetical protein